MSEVAIYNTIYYTPQSVTKTVPEGETDTPIDVPLPEDIGPVKEITIEVVTTKEGTEKPPPTSVEVVVKGCLHGKQGP